MLDLRRLKRMVRWARMRRIGKIGKKGWLETDAFEKKARRTTLREGGGEFFV